MFNSKRKKYKPAEYFSGQELEIAEAIYHGEKKQLSKFFESGHDINTVGQAGFTYLMYAIMLEDYGMTEFLLEKGANPNQLSPLMKNRFNRDREESEKMPLNMLPLETCCEHYPIKWMKLLIKYGADLNDNRTETPIEAAITTDDMEKIEYLLRSGVDINQPYQSNTPVMIAAQIMSWDVVDILLNRDANVFHVNRNGYSLGLYLQNYINRDIWTPEERKKIEDLIGRLKEKGVEFPVTKQEPRD